VSPPAGLATGRDAPAPPVLSVEGVRRRFGGVVALAGVSFDARAGEVVAIVGQNGAGKTTLFDCVLGVTRPDAGRVLLAGEDVTALPVHERARRGMARTFQHVALFGELSVREHLLVADRARRGAGGALEDLLRGGRPTPAEQERVERILGRLGLLEVGDVPAVTLPLGRARLVELGRALALRPVVLLADEPSSGLDAGERDVLVGALGEVARNDAVAVVLVEHDLDVVRRLAATLVVLEAGHVLDAGPVEKVLAAPEVRERYLGVGVGP
jgi:branched-chain amino acid transport system ATP-binding protein